MRTTLKRGYGRGAEVNGNGHGVIPPGTLSPVTLYRQPPPAKPSLVKAIGKFFLWLFVVLLMVVAGLVGGFYLWAHETLAAARCHTLDCKKTETHLAAVEDPNQAAIALVIGYDHRAGDGTGSPSRSDTMMLIRADPGSKTISLLSFPRDLIVPLYCGKASYPIDHGRINTAYALCGSVGALDTVRHLTGLPVNYMISVNFSGFVAVVNKLGGVWLDIDRRYYNKNVGTIETNYADIDLQPGYQLLNGKQALEFVRYRHTDSDLYRLARQQEFMSAMRQQASRSLGLTSAVGLVNTITGHHYVEIASPRGHQADLGTIRSYAAFAHGLPAGHVFQNKLTQVTGYNELFASQSAIDEAVQSFMTPDVDTARTNTAVALGRKLKKKFVLPPSKTTLAVLNGNGVAGSASNGSYLLAQKGYKIALPPSGQPANAPNWSYFHSKVYFDPARAANGKASAQQVARLVGSADVEPMPNKIRTDLSNGALLVLVVGSTFHNRLAPIVVPQAPVRHPPYIRSDGGTTRAVLAKYKKRLPFRLQYPSVIERGSQLDTGYGETPVRVYKLGGQPTIRLTYRFGANQYWGIQETAWDEAPVLADKSLSQTVGGRRFDLYYNGSHLHMVVLRTGGATYWVVNSLLDELSNETMLAIARGFRPMTR
jgi:LCP family protein required for cell wall assembly